MAGDAAEGVSRQVQRDELRQALQPAKVERGEAVVGEVDDSEVRVPPEAGGDICSAVDQLQGAKFSEVLKESGVQLDDVRISQKEVLHAGDRR